MLQGIGWDFYFSNAVMIIPLQALSKRPLKGLSWKEFDMWDFDWETHDGNIGVVCGQTTPEGTKRLCVVDFDTTNTPPYCMKSVPLKLFQALESCKTLSVLTPRRGLHFYTLLPVEMDVSIIRAAWGEVRCQGSYVVAPQSQVLCSDGEVRPYRFIGGPPADFWTAVKDAPDELIELAKQRGIPKIDTDPFVDAEEVPQRVADPFCSPPAINVPGGRVIRIEPYAETIAAIVGGVGESESPCDGIRGRNDAAFHYAYYLLKTEQKSEFETWQTLVQWNRKNRPPLDHKELTATFRSAVAYVARRAQERPALETVTYTPSFSLPTVWQRLQQGAEPARPVYAPLAFKGGITILYGPPGEGKSFAMLRMGIAAAQAGFKVVYLSLEMAEPMVLSYLETMLAHEKIDPSGELYVVYKEADIVGVDDADLVIIDALRTFRPGVDLNDSKQVEAMMQQLRSEFGADKAIVLVHHTNKPALGPNAHEIDPRAMAEGSLRLISASDVAAYLHRDTTVFLIDVVKSRYTSTTTIKRRFPFSAKQVVISGAERIDW